MRRDGGSSSGLRTISGSCGGASVLAVPAVSNVPSDPGGTAINSWLSSTDIHFKRIPCYPVLEIADILRPRGFLLERFCRNLFAAILFQAMEVRPTGLLLHPFGRRGPDPDEDGDDALQTSAGCAPHEFSADRGVRALRRIYAAAGHRAARGRAFHAVPDHCVGIRLGDGALLFHF